MRRKEDALLQVYQSFEEQSSFAPTISPFDINDIVGTPTAPREKKSKKRTSAETTLNMKKTSLYLSAELYKTAKIYCAENSCSFTNLVNDSLKSFLGKKSRNKEI